MSNQPENRHLKLKCQSSLGKRLCSALYGDQLHDCSLSITFAASFQPGLKANCWLKDEEGVLGLTLDRQALEALHQKLGEALADQKWYDNFGKPICNQK